MIKAFHSLVVMMASVNNINTNSSKLSLKGITIYEELKLTFVFHTLTYKGIKCNYVVILKNTRPLY